MAGGEGYSGPSVPPNRPDGWGNVGGKGSGVGGGGAGHAFGGAGGSAPPLPAIPPFFPPEYFPPAGHIDFLPNGFNAAQTLANGVVVLASYQLRKNNRGVIRSISVGVGNFTAAGAVLFQLRIGGLAVSGWGNIPIPPQPAAFATFSLGPDETRIDIPFGSLVQLTGQITAGGPFDMFAAAHGWEWGS